MKIIHIGNLEVQLIKDQAFLYFLDSSDVLNIEGIEENPDAQSIIEREIEALQENSIGNMELINFAE